MPSPRPQRQRPGAPQGEEDAGMRSVESKIDLIVQKIKNMEKNEEVIGRTLVAQNERLKKLEGQVASGGGGGGASAAASAASAAEIAELRKEVDELAKAAAKQEDLLELKYTLDEINPLEFARADQMQEFVRDEIAKQLEEKDKKKK
jgi:hypothetical protein